MLLDYFIFHDEKRRKKRNLYKSYSQLKYVKMLTSGILIKFGFLKPQNLSKDFEALERMSALMSIYVKV